MTARRVIEGALVLGAFAIIGAVVGAIEAGAPQAVTAAFMLSAALFLVWALLVRSDRS